MQNISFLLKNIEVKKNEIQIIAETISSVSGIKILEREVSIISGKGFNKLKLNVSGSKKIVLVLKKDTIQQSLDKFSLILVL